MKRVIVMASMVVILGTAAAGVYGQEKDTSPSKAETTTMYTCLMHPEVKATWEGKCPKCSMALVKPEKKTDTEMGCRCPMCMMARKGKTEKPATAEKTKTMMRKMKKMGMTEPMMMRCRMMMRANIDAYNPIGLLALKDELKLTKEQAERLQTIAEKARKDAEGVLDNKQKKKVQELSETPSSMMKMHEKMSPMMGKMMGGKGKGGPMMCPMMRMRDGKSASETPSTEPAE